MNIRELTREEIPQIWDIDRREVIDGIYYLRDGQLVLEAEHYNLEGWSLDEAQKYTLILLDCFDHGGSFWGAFEADHLIGAAILENRFIGKNNDQLQLKFLHVSYAYRGQGLGGQLFRKACDIACQKNAKKLYISATPSENTIHFYLHLGCTITQDVNPELYALEPEDIHLEYSLICPTPNAPPS